MNRRVELPGLGVRAAALSLLLAWACGEPETGSASAMPADAPGPALPTVTHAESAWRNAPVHELAAPVRVFGEGAVEAAVALRVRTAVLADNGHVVVLTRAPARLLVFDSTGPLLHATSTTTRGESDDSAALQLIGDTVLVWEPAERRIQTFTPDGRRSVTSWTETAAHARFRLPDGTLAGVAPGPDPPPPSGIRRPRHYVLRYHPGDSPADTLREVSGEPLWIQPGASGPQSWRLPFGPVPAIGFDANHVYVACEDDAFRYDVLDWTGLVARRVQVETAPPPVTEEDAAAYREAWSRWAMTRGSAYSARFGDLPSAILFRDRRPACSDVRISTDHRVWIAEYVQLDAVPREWTVFGADGALLGRVRVPEGLRLTHVTADRAVAIQTAPGGDRVLLFRLPSLD